MRNGGINPFILVAILGIKGIWEYSLQLQGNLKITWRSLFRLYLVCGTVPVIAHSRAWVCGRPLARTAGLTPASSMDVCLF